MQYFQKSKLRQKIHNEQNIKILNKDKIQESPAEPYLDPEAKGKMSTPIYVFMYF